MTDLRIGDTVVAKSEIGRVVGLDAKGGAILERGDFYALVVIPVLDLVKIPDQS